MAAQKFKAECHRRRTGRGACASRARREFRKLRIDSLARIIHGDILQQDYSSADLLTVYLLPASNDKLRPVLDAQLKKGTRIVAHDFEFRDWKPVQVLDIDNDGEGRSHRLYLYEK